MDQCETTAGRNEIDVDKTVGVVSLALRFFRFSAVLCGSLRGIVDKDINAESAERRREPQRARKRREHREPQRHTEPAAINEAQDS
jgi:hypothetical protein